MYKCIHGHAPDRLCNEIEMVFDRHGMNTRNANSLKVTIPKPNIECFKRSFKYIYIYMQVLKSGTICLMNYTMLLPLIPSNCCIRRSMFTLTDI